MNTFKKFATQETAASNLSELYELLISDNSNSRFIYRGQTCDYPLPLLPSAFRSLFSFNDKPIEANHPLMRYSLRKCGTKFFGDCNYKIMQSTQRMFSKIPDDEQEKGKAALDKVMKDSLIATMQMNDRARGNLMSWFDELEFHLTADEKEIFYQNRIDWLPIINRYHRRIIRMFFFHFIFGYTMGTLLAQQYGLHSDCLDGTTDLDVAAFFATHDHIDDYISVQKEGVGVIYRFPYAEVAGVSKAYEDFYELPPIIDAAALLQKSAIPSDTLENMQAEFRKHCVSVYNESESNAVNWHIPESAVEQTRIWRQKAVIILPDELQKKMPGKRSGVAGITVPAFQYIEDIAERRGVEKFYFKHSGQQNENCRVNREYLWPREDPLIPIIASGMTCVYPIIRFSPHIIPYRLDLIDSGYQKNDFLNLCKQLARNNPIILWDEDGIEAAANGAIVL